MTIQARDIVILAAGRGDRLNGGPPGRPKPLLHVAGRPLLDHALHQAAAAGCERAVVVVGHRAADVAAHLSTVACGIEVDVVVNPDYDAPNGVSLLAAAPYVQAPFFLLMADHVFERPVLADLMAPASSRNATASLLVDPAPSYFVEDDATKVDVRDGRVVAIGKELRPYNGIDAGAFLLGGEVFAALRQAAGSRPPSVTDAMRLLISNGGLDAVPLRATRWVDVDTPSDVVVAESTMAPRATSG